MRAIITGAGGFVGRHAALAFARAGHEVTALVHRFRPQVLEGRPGLDIVQADLASPGRLPLPAGGDILVHCASALPSTQPDPDALFRANVQAMENLLTWSEEAGIGCYINCSSMAAYGRIRTDLVDETTPSVEPDAYGRSKLQCERLLHAWAGKTRNSLSLRLPGVVGVGSHDNFLSNVMACILADQPVTARNGDALFNNIVHIDDLTRFMLALADSLPAGHRAVPIAADEPIAIREVISELYRAAGKAEQVTYEAGAPPFLISPEAARALGYAVPTTRDSVRRFARDCVAAAGKP